MQEFFLQVDEEEAWIREREPQAGSTDYGKDHSGVVALQQKHQALEAEIQGGSFITLHLYRVYRLYLHVCMHTHNNILLPMCILYMLSSIHVSSCSVCIWCVFVSEMLQ